MTSTYQHQDAVHQQQKHGNAVGPIGTKQQKPPIGAEAKNRRVLVDIGNTVNLARANAEGKPLDQVSRPLTRSFRAQLLLNGQLVEDQVPLPAITKVKKPVKKESTNLQKKVNEEDPVDVGKEAAKGKVNEKESKTEVVIEKIPTTISCVKSRKKVHSLTSVLTARSKDACGISEKPKKSNIQDIDAGDANDQLAIVEYVEDIYTFYRLVENVSKPRDKYMNSQVEINSKMRSILFDWLIEVHLKFELTPEVLYLTFYIIDKYLSTAVVLKRELQLVGISSMLIACKYEEIWAPEVDDFISISDLAYSRQRILAMEKEILGKLEWSITVPTPYVFLVRFIKAAMSDKEMEHMVFFFAELGMMNYSILAYSPSMLAASAVYAARWTLKKTPHWDDTLKKHTGFCESELQACTRLLLLCNYSASDSNLKAVFKKYSSPLFGAVALQPVADGHCFQSPPVC